MGAFNEVRGKVRCPSCRNVVETDIQFKYGSVVHYQYKLADKLVWGNNDVGRPARVEVVLDGEGGRCPECAYDGDWPVYVHVRDDVLVAVENSTGTYDFVVAKESFLVLRE